MCALGTGPCSARYCSSVIGTDSVPTHATSSSELTTRVSRAMPEDLMASAVFVTRCCADVGPSGTARALALERVFRPAVGALGEAGGFDRQIDSRMRVP